MPLRTVRAGLKNLGLKHISTKGGHEKWVRSDLFWPVILQTHVDPVPVHVIKQILRALHIDRESFIQACEK